MHLHVPGAELPGIHYLRSFDDAQAIHAAARRGSRVVVIGASFIGMEVSASLKQKGLHVTLLAPQGDLFATLQAPAISRFFSAIHAEHGLEVASSEVAALEGSEPVEAVLTSDDSYVDDLTVDHIVASGSLPRSVPTSSPATPRQRGLSNPHSGRCAESCRYGVKALPHRNTSATRVWWWRRLRRLDQSCMRLDPLRLEQWR